MNHLPFLYRCNISYQQKKVPFPLLLLMEEILHHLGCIKLMKTPVNNGITYQPQLVSRMSAINRMCVYWEGQPPLVFLASFKSSGNRPSQLDDTSLLSITSCFHPFRYQVVIPAEYSPTHVTHHHHVETKNIYMTKKIHANQSINQSINSNSTASPNILVQTAWAPGYCRALVRSGTPIRWESYSPFASWLPRWLEVHEVQERCHQGTNISHQTGSSENHQLKSVGWNGIC